MDRQPVAPSNYRAILVRLLLLSGVLFWAIWKLGAEREYALARVVHPLPAPGERPVPVEAPPRIVDPEALLRVSSAARGESERCGVTTGTLSARVGFPGLVEARLTGRADEAAVACVREAVWALPWPRGQQELETEVEW